MTELAIHEWREDADVTRDVAGLAEVLHASVHAGASVSFVLPFSMTDAEVYWREIVLPSVRTGARRLLVARMGDRVVGTVQLILDTPPNQSHRAEIAKLLVHPEARRVGAGRSLMLAIEQTARAAGRTLLTLDTRTGDKAEPLYRSLGYITAGVIPGFARGPHSKELEGTTIMYKTL